MVRTSPAPQGASHPLGAYIETQMARARERLQGGAPEDRKEALMPASWFEAWSTAVLATDPLGSKQNPPVLRSPADVDRLGEGLSARCRKRASERDKSQQFHDDVFHGCSPFALQFICSMSGNFHQITPNDFLLGEAQKL